MTCLTDILPPGGPQPLPYSLKSDDLLAGILLKAIAKRSYPILSMVIYMVMGWCAIFFLPDLLARAQPLFLVFIVLGGLMYTDGAFFYAQPKHAYFHFIWHLFINLASIFHFIALIFFL